MKYIGWFIFFPLYIAHRIVGRSNGIPWWACLLLGLWWASWLCLFKEAAT